MADEGDEETSSLLFLTSFNDKGRLVKERSNFNERIKFGFFKKLLFVLKSEEDDEEENP